MSTQEKMDFFELGDKTSLICADPNTTEVAKATLRELGFKCHTAETPELAVERMRYTNYDCIIVQESFAGTEAAHPASVTRYSAFAPPATMPNTRSPSRQRVTSVPAAATSPANSSPGMSAGAPGGAG